jgi:hypothetical protein
MVRRIAHAELRMLAATARLRAALVDVIRRALSLSENATHHTEKARIHPIAWDMGGAYF